MFPQNYLARNFYNLRFLALFVAFAINFILLFYKVNRSRDAAAAALIDLFLAFSGDGRLLG